MVKLVILLSKKIQDFQPNDIYIFHDNKSLSTEEKPQSKYRQITYENLLLFHSINKECTILYAFPLVEHFFQKQLKPLIQSYDKEISVINVLKNFNQNEIEDKICKETCPQMRSFIFYFKDQTVCTNFYQEFHNLNIQQQIFTLLKIDQVIYTDDISLAKPFLKNGYPIPTCLSCLEKIDTDSTHIEWSSVLINKVHFGEFLQCKVCNIMKNKMFFCQECNEVKDLWVCIICGFIGCGRYSQKHAYDHFLKTEHNLSIEVKSEMIWDYLKDTYVHRLPDDIGQEQLNKRGIYSDNDLINLMNNLERVIKEQLQEQKNYYREQERIQSVSHLDKSNELKIELQTKRQKLMSLQKEQEEIKEKKRIENENIQRIQNLILKFKNSIQEVMQQDKG